MENHFTSSKHTLYVHTNKHTVTQTPFRLSVSLVRSMASPPVVESASREHQDFSLPDNLPVRPTKSICSDLWCWAAPTMVSPPHSQGTVGPAHLPVWLTGWLLLLSLHLLSDCSLCVSLPHFRLRDGETAWYSTASASGSCYEYA